MRFRVFTARSVAVGVAAGALIAAWIGWGRGADMVLAALNGLAGGVLALAVFTYMQDGRFELQPWRRLGVRALLAAIIVSPMIYLDDVMGNELPQATGSSLSMLFMLTGLAAYFLGGILTTLDHLDGDDGRNPSEGPRLHRVPPPPAT
ncbi:MAG: hypothetical protein F4Z04_04490 [Acidobacteria bacterium]|nr:hypothetical protein [Acidobacteriota bacterium]